jgi:hypothetical protein
VRLAGRTRSRPLAGGRDLDLIEVVGLLGQRYFEEHHPFEVLPYDGDNSNRYSDEMES